MGRQSNFRDYFETLKNYYHKHYHIPSFSELSDLLGVASKNTIHNFFQKLVDHGYFINDNNSYKPTDKFIGIPVYESVQAGTPSPAQDENKFTINLQNYVINKPNTSVLIQVKGDSMQDAGINENDIVVVNTAQQPKIGDIVIGVVDDDYTIKFLMQDKKGAKYLQPANKEKGYPNIYPQENLHIFGVVTSVVRKYY